MGQVSRLAGESRLLYLSAMGQMQPRQLEDLVWVDADRMSGSPCFKGTRIPIQMLFDHLSAGYSLDEFLETVPSLDRVQTQKLIGLAGEQMKDRATSMTNGSTDTEGAGSHVIGSAKIEL